MNHKSGQLIYELIGFSLSTSVIASEISLTPIEFTKKAFFGSSSHPLTSAKAEQFII